MREALANKYVKALLLALNKEEQDECLQALQAIQSGFSHPKMEDILGAPVVSQEQKTSFILSLLERPSLKITNFIRVLGLYGRLPLIPAIARELSNEISLSRNSYTGVVVSDGALEGTLMKELEERFSAKVGASISLIQHPEQYDGIRISVDALGMEIGFSKGRLKQQLSEHILKAI